MRHVGISLIEAEYRNSPIVFIHALLQRNNEGKKIVVHPVGQSIHTASSDDLNDPSGHCWQRLPSGDRCNPGEHFS
ncbi:hypothetical protein RB195_015481 [Necator americanus]|uniref:Uncharacterized protein n=1 Tax=Necator americanus TaxID=51031 RepID=A0ABR1E4U5_NECAM